MALRLFISLFMAIAITFTCAAGDPYTVSGVLVDAEADNALEAQTTAIADGQTRAANTVIARLSLADERNAKGFRGVSQEDSAKMIRALGIDNEKRSANRYLGDITVAFNRSAVSQYMRAYGLTLIATQSRQRLVIPVVDGQGLWSSNPWMDAWAKSDFQNSLTPMTGLTAKQGTSGLFGDTRRFNPSIQTLKAIGAAYGVQQILIVRAQPSASGYSVRVQDVALDVGESRDLGRITGFTPEDAAAKTVELVESDWKQASVSKSTGEAVVLPVSVLYRSHADWQRLQDVINNSAQIKSAQLQALSKSGASMLITYGGDFERLRNELSFKGVTIREDQKMGLILSRTGVY